MLASAFLTIAAAAEHARAPAPAGRIPLTRNEIVSLFTRLIIRPAHDTWHRMRWSSWRRRHQLDQIRRSCRVHAKLAETADGRPVQARFASLR